MRSVRRRPSPRWPCLGTAASASTGPPQQRRGRPAGSRQSCCLTAPMPRSTLGAAEDGGGWGCGWAALELVKHGDVDWMPTLPSSRLSRVLAKSSSSSVVSVAAPRKAVIVKNWRSCSNSNWVRGQG
uniref:Uncharacterized protein n=1 Tax=Setaria viridis TaxID=4556 RepID=A0A4U6VRH2_SETVI|nr:hypothetical protein SEVIR_3G244700v2 [Setaria viridis]